MPWRIHTYTPEERKKRPGILGHMYYQKAEGTGHNRQPRNLNNDPDRAPGMQPFDIDGMTIYAGTRKAAVKKRNLIIKHTT